MDVWRITIAALRRWYVLFPLLALTGFAVMAAEGQAAPEYEGRASVMLSPSRGFPEAPNPYSSINGAQEALPLVLNATETRRQIASDGLTASYEVAAPPRSTIIHITTRGETPGATEEVGQAVIDKAAQELSTRQDEAEVPESEQYTLEVLETPTVIATVETSQVRVQAVVGVLGAGLSILVAVVFDDIIGLYRRSRAKRRRRASRKLTETPEENPDQLTLDDIPVVELELVKPDSDATEKPRNTHSTDNGATTPAHIARPARLSPSRSHSSLLAEAYAEANFHTGPSKPSDEEHPAAVEEEPSSDASESELNADWEPAAARKHGESSQPGLNKPS
ncbi:hypothetical protein [Phytoactinopolyspora halotolerans]|uniref:Capsular polysaccharide biosynthesis protein n=1 Tax=Phytoactinopolyspora halotolerans TaxID=1981512 RepID=A0A6L9S2C2_9ACTN|nr:hypothetical protein [Phytoactinopolyspora halotolerans]NED99604.1 hypothetical protein [Phytoactinopolyspora halotolerans]